jgi:hypothetical protein
VIASSDAATAGIEPWDGVVYRGRRQLLSTGVTPRSPAWGSTRRSTRCVLRAIPRAAIAVETTISYSNFSELRDRVVGLTLA